MIFQLLLLFEQQIYINYSCSAVVLIITVKDFCYTYVLHVHNVKTLNSLLLMANKKSNIHTKKGGPTKLNQRH